MEQHGLDGPEGSIRKEGTGVTPVAGGRGQGQEEVKEVRKERQPEIYRPTQRAKEAGGGERKKAQRAKERGRGVSIVFKAISDKSSLARSPEDLFPASGGSLEYRRRPEDSSLGGCGPSGEGVPREDGPQPLGETRGAPSIPDVLQVSPGPAAPHPRDRRLVSASPSFPSGHTPLLSLGFERAPTLGERSRG